MIYNKFLILLTIVSIFSLAGFAKQPAGELLLKDSIMTDGQRYVKELKIYPNPVNDQLTIENQESVIKGLVQKLHKNSLTFINNLI